MVSGLVFISYANPDQAAATAVCQGLEAAGLRCWIAPRDIPPGDEYAGAIADALAGCRALVVIFSAAADQSRHVQNEVDLAFNQGRPIIPFRVSDAVPSRGMAYYLNRVQWLDARQPPLADRIRELVTAVSRTVAPAETKAPPTQTSAQPHLPAVPPPPPRTAVPWPFLIAVPDAANAPLTGLAPGSAEAQRTQQQAAMALGWPLEVRAVKSGLTFRLVPAGSFLMGTPENPPGNAFDSVLAAAGIWRPVVDGRRAGGGGVR